ncbi:MAG: T9SS type A sorting domain-containing protein [Flavobacteriales bacterium]|nr:T9SS type A sorting domain-containing protein [Flavobacteriales bacterium]
MNRSLRSGAALTALVLGIAGHAQRYLTEVFTSDQVTITSDVVYGTNIDFLRSNLATPNLVAEITELQTAVTLGNPIPAPYFNPTDASTGLKVTNVQMDIYAPPTDEVTERPVVLYLHTGNALPPPLNGSPTGTRKDSTAVETCMRFARRGYVAVSMSYRLGWNPLADTEQQRRGQLLNAIYRAIHDVRQCVRNLKANAATYGIDPDKIVVYGEGTGGYIALANATLDRPAELFIEKFRPDPFNASVSYIDTTQVGNLSGFNGNLALYRPNGQSHETHFCVNTGGALADSTWLEAGDVPMVAFHTVFDPFAPFSNGIVIVPTTGGPVVPVSGSNVFMEFVNEYGNNSSFATLPDGDPFTDRARALYGSTQTHGSNNVTINTNVEGLFPMVRPQWPAPALEEASPWQWWDPNSAAAQAVVSPGPPPITAHVASLASNPDMSAAKGRAYIDTIQGYLNPRIVCALQLGPCSLVGIDEDSEVAQGVDVFPNPATDRVTFTSTNSAILTYEVYDVNGRLVRTAQVNNNTAVMDREGLKAGAYSVQLRLKEGNVVRKLMLD